MKEKVAVVGLNYQGLCVARLLGQAGYDVYDFCLPHEMAWGEFRCSRYLRGKVEPYYGVSDLNCKLENLASSVSIGQPLKVFITSSDSLANLVSDDRELWERYNGYSGPLEAIDFFSNKALMYKRCLDLGIKVKNFCLLSEYRSGMLSFPLILKRNVEKGLMEYKCCKVSDEKQLSEIVRTIPEHSQKYIILQECINDTFEDVDFRGYVHKGKIIGYSVMREIRCYPAGVSSYIEELTDKEMVAYIHNDVLKLLDGTNFSGFMDIDLKCNFNTGESFVLDFNPRSPASLSAWVFKYKRRDLINLFQNIDNPTELSSVNNAIRWCNLSRDYKARKKYGKVNVWDVLNSKMDVWDAHDPLPFLLQPLWIFLRKIKKMRALQKARK